MEEFNRRLKAQRSRAGKTQAQIAAVLSVSTKHYANMETGERSVSLQYLIKLCRFYNVSADYFLGLDDYPYPPGDINGETCINPKFFAMDDDGKLRVNEMINLIYRGED